MENQKAHLDSLKEKLKSIGQPSQNQTLEVKLSSTEAIAYDLESNDVLSLKEIKLESEGDYE